jgi:hypothetical protein
MMLIDKPFLYRLVSNECPVIFYYFPRRIALSILTPELVIINNFKTKTADLLYSHTVYRRLICLLVRYSFSCPVFLQSSREADDESEILVIGDIERKGKQTIKNEANGLNLHRTVSSLKESPRYIVWKIFHPYIWG